MIIFVFRAINCVVVLFVFICIGLMQAFAQQNVAVPAADTETFRVAHMDEDQIKALEQRLRVFDQPCLVDAAHVFLRSAGQSIPVRPHITIQTGVTIIPRGTQLHYRTEETRIHLPIKIVDLEAAAPTAETVREAIYHLAAGRRDIAIPVRSVPGCAVHMSIVQAQLLRHITWRAIDFRSPTVQPIGRALAGTDRPPAPASRQQAAAAALAGAEEQEPYLRVFDQTCATRAVITAVGEEVTQLTPERLTQFKDTMILLGWLPSTCIIRVAVVRPVLMAALLRGLPTTIDEVTQQLGHTATARRP
jgi:hypothetical protein